MTILQDILAALNWQVRVNENFSAVAPAGLFGKKDSTTTGLTLGYYGGVLDGVSYGDGTHLLTASTTRYVVAKRSDGVVSSSTSNTNWNNQTDYLRMGIAVVGSASITSWADWREAYSGGGGGGSSFTGGTLTSAINEAPIATIASSSTPAIGAAAANSISITGTTTITGFDSIASGAKRKLIFSGILILTHNATSLILPTGANITTAAGDSAEFLSLGSGNWRCVEYQRANGQALAASGGSAVTQCIPIACSDETTALTAGTAKVTFRMPFAFTLSAVRASVTTAPTGSVLTVDINEGGSSILSTKLTIDATEKTSTTAATPAVISDSSLADDAEITIDIDGVGSTVAGAGLKVYLIGTN